MAATVTSKIAMVETSQVVVTIRDDDGISQAHTLALFNPDGTSRDVNAEIASLLTAADGIVAKRRAAFGAIGL